MDGLPRTAIVGAGGLGTGLGKALQETTSGTVVAIADVNDDARARAGATLDVPADAQFANYEAMLDTVALDAVIIATPHTLHYEQTVAALERDLHVLCEKPLTTDLGAARDLVERSRRSEQVLMVGYQRRIEGPYVAAREHLQGFESPPTFVTSEITQNWISNQQEAWRSNPELSGGGQLYDTGSHIVDFVLWATGLTPTAVTASMCFWDDAQRVDTQATLTLEFETDTVASISVSGDAPQVREHHRLWTDDGAVYVDGQNWDPRDVRVVEPDGTERRPDPHSQYPNKVVPFVEAIEHGREPPSTPEDALRVTAVTEAAYEAARTGRRVPVEL